MDFAQLTSGKASAGSIANWTNNGTVQPVAASMVAEAEGWIYARLRHWRMLTPPAAGSLSIGSDTIALPADLLEPFLLRITGVSSGEIAQRTPQEIYRLWAFDSTGARVNQRPRYYAFDQSSLRFDAPPDQSYPYILVYFQKPAALSGGNLTNFLTSFYPRLLRAACMAQACEFLKDSGQGTFDRTYWDQMAQAEIDVAQAESDRAHRATTGGAIIL